MGKKKTQPDLMVEVDKSLLVFSLAINFTTVKEQFHIHDASCSLTIGKLKENLELKCGIPEGLQRLHFLDAADLDNSKTLRQNDVVATSTLQLSVWKEWETLVECAYKGDLSGLESFLKEKEDESTFIEELQRIALFIAASRGHVTIVDRLLKSGCDVNYQIGSGRTALHVAAVSNGNSECVRFLLSKGALFTVTDHNRKTPGQLAAEFSCKLCEKEIFQFNWQTRAAKKCRTQKAIPPMMHQQFDSANPTWIRGEHAQMYMSSTGKQPHQRETATQTTSLPTHRELLDLVIDEINEPPASNRLLFKGKYNKTFERWLIDKEMQRLQRVRLQHEQRLAELKELELKKYQNALKNEQRQRQWKISKKDHGRPASDCFINGDANRHEINIYTDQDYVPNFEKLFLDIAINNGN